MRKKDAAKKVWHFIWEDDSIWSWVVNIILAFVLIKFIVYPGLGFALGTSHPVVAVVSESMEHNTGFEEWWPEGGKWYEQNSIPKNIFTTFPLRNGFNKGDIIVLGSAAMHKVDVGDIIVFQTRKPDPIIHRVVKKWDVEGIFFLTTKGDNYETNRAPIKSPLIDETQIVQEQLIGKALIRIPLLGYIKIWFVGLVQLGASVFSP